MRASLGAWIVSCVVLSLVLSAEATRYVSPTGGNIPPYNTWARAARDIQTAVNAAANGELVLVNNGTYALPATLTVSRGIILRSANVRGANFAGVELATVTMDFANFSQALNADIPSYKVNLR